MTTSNPPLSYGRQFIDQDDIDAVIGAMQNDYLTQGPAVGEFEAALATFLGVQHVIAVSSGTAALHLAALAAGVGPGDLGVTSDVTFVASANGMRYAGAQVLLCDVDPNTGLVNVDALEVMIQKHRPKMVVPVDFTGAVVDLPRILAAARKVGAIVVEDAAHALGSTYSHEGKVFKAASCAHTDMAILSFHPVKHITTLEGGAITTNDAALAKRLRLLRSHGITKDPADLSRQGEPWWYEQQALGYHYRITDLQCALGTSQLKKLPRFVARRRELAQAYDREIKKALERHGIDPGLALPTPVPDGCASAYHLYVLRIVLPELERSAAVRKQLFFDLKAEQIYCQVHYIPVHMQPNFQPLAGSYAGAERFYSGCISLPMHPQITDADVMRVADAVARSLQKSVAR